MAECGETTSCGANTVQFTLARTCSRVNTFVCKRMNSGLIAGDPWLSVSLWRRTFLRRVTETRISVLQQPRGVKEIGVSMEKRRSAAERALCGRFPWSAHGFRLSKVTLKAAGHAGKTRIPV